MEKSWVRFTRVAATTPNGGADRVEGRAGPKPYGIDVRRLWPFGLRSRPPAGCDAAVVHNNGGASSGMMVGAESDRYGPGDLDEGEAALYCAVEGVGIRLNTDGDVLITSDAGNGKIVQVNGSAHAVAREADPVRITSPGALATWMGQVESALSGLGGVVPSPPAATFLASPGLAIKSGSPTFKTG